MSLFCEGGLLNVHVGFVLKPATQISIIRKRASFIEQSCHSIAKREVRFEKWVMVMNNYTHASFATSRFAESEKTNDKERKSERIQDLYKDIK